MMAIVAALFVLLFAFALCYCCQRLLYALWNGKSAQKVRKEAIEALSLLQKLNKENIGDCNEKCIQDDI